MIVSDFTTVAGGALCRRNMMHITITMASERPTSPARSLGERGCLMADLSERVSYREMEREGILEFDIEIVGSPVPVWSMKSISEIPSDHDHSEIHTKSDSGAERDVLKER